MPRNATYKSIPIIKKLEILEEAKQVKNDREVARKYGIAPVTIRDWRKQQGKLEKEIIEKRGALKRGKKSVSSHAYPEMEIVLSAWIREVRELGYRVDQKSIKAIAYHFLEELMIPHALFKASNGWINGFIKRNQLSNRSVSTLNQHDPADVGIKVTRFLLYTRKILEENQDYKVWACDETPVFYDLISKKTYDQVGKKEIKIKTSGGDKKLFTVVPLAASDGSKNPLQFNGKGKAKGDEELLQRTNANVLFSDNGWMQTPTTINFLKKNFSPDEKNILIWDSYKCHYQGEDIKDTIKQLKIKNVIIPGGCTRAIQTCDVVWNSPLKMHLRESWAKWMREGDKTFTKGGKMRTMTKAQLVDNVVEAWEKITPEMIKKSFEICGQVLNFDPERLLCMREGKTCNGSLPQLKELLRYPSSQLNLDKLEPLAGDVEQVDMDIEAEEDLVNSSIFKK